MDSFEEFCGGPIWNNTQFMSSPWPRLTPCFQDTVFVWLPSAIIFVFGPCYVNVLRHQRHVSGLPIRSLNACKLFCQLALIILTVGTLFIKVGHDNQGLDVPVVSYLAEIIRVLTFTAVAGLTQYERRKGVTASRLQFMFWVITMAIMFIRTYSLTMLQTYEEDMATFVITVVNSALSLVCFICNCMSEHPGIRKVKGGYYSMEKYECPYNAAGALSRLFFFWMFRLIRLGYSRDIQESDVWALPQDMECDYHVPLFEKLWREEEERCLRLRKRARPDFGVSYDRNANDVKALFKTEKPEYRSEKTRLLDGSSGQGSLYGNCYDYMQEQAEIEELPKPSLGRVLWKQFGFGFFVFTASKIMADLGVICGPLMLNVLISYMENRRPGNEWQGYSICVIMFLLCIYRICFFNYSNYVSFRVAMNAKSVLVTAIYKKGLAVVVVLIPLNMWTAAKQRDLQRINLTFKDTRIRMVNEILNGIKALKLYAWEQCFHDRVQSVRAQEIATLLKVAMYYVVTGVCWSIAGFLITLATFTTFILSDPNNYLDPGRAFMTLALFNILKAPMDLMATVITVSAQALVSLRRINNFLLYEELAENSVVVDPNCPHAVSFDEAEMSWDETSPATLKNINLNIPDGKLVAVVGPVGAGKSSLISAILGDMEKKRGTITRKGTMAYVPQQAWIQNATVRDNITFGKVFREKKYKVVVSTCELERDFTILTAGDQTEIGEKGINLSGGQKQRVSVARAVYQDSDLYLLDDPLSAVDSHVGKAMFEQVIGPRGLLKNKTRILVTHGVHFLPMVDFIVVMNNGKISEMGTYEELMAHDGAFARFLRDHLTQEQLEGGEDDDADVAEIKDRIWDRIEMLTSDAATSADEHRSLRRRREMTHSLTESRKEKRIREEKTAGEPGKLVTVEVLAKGRVDKDVYMRYIRAAGVLPLSVACFLFWSFQAISVGTNFWLTDWTDNPFLANRSNPTDEIEDVNHNFLGMYALLGLAQLICLIGYYYLFWTRMVTAGRNLHSQMTTRLFKAPMSFFDTTPVGRILNRCSRDIEITDNLLPLICRDFISTFGTVVITVLVVLIQTPIFGAVLVPVVVLFYFGAKFYVPTSRQLRRIENVTRSPIYTHFSESLTGASVIRAYAATQRFVAESQRRVDHNTVFFYSALMSLRWNSVHLDLLASIVVFSSGFFQVLSPDSDAGITGLTVSYALQLTQSLPWMVRNVSDFETNIVSVERLKEYSEVDQEAAWIVATKRPPHNWPDQGTVEFRDFSVRYREGLDLVIKKMNIRIDGGQKVGIVGRTGAGKSSLSLSLFRLMETAGGCIMVDGINIADIGLHDLRSRLTILPQDPVLYSGTLRLNLDPFDEFTDEDIWTALERAHLKHFVHQLPDRLMYECGEEGQNLSVGQRQLVCLARTLLRKTKVLILDEATAAVDMQTDTLIQNTIRLAFHNCTIIAIAHRLNTILDYDKVIVLDAGEIQEYDSPTNLLHNTDSIFHSMAVDANLI